MDVELANAFVLLGLKKIRPLLDEAEFIAAQVIQHEVKDAMAEALEKQRNRVVNAMQEAIDNLRPVPTYPVPNVVDDLAAAIRALREPTP
jgi:hypothetical protein